MLRRRPTTKRPCRFDLAPCVRQITDCSLTESPYADFVDRVLTSYLGPSADHRLSEQKALRDRCLGTSEPRMRCTRRSYPARAISTAVHRDRIRFSPRSYMQKRTQNICAMVTGIDAICEHPIPTAKIIAVRQLSGKQIQRW